MKFSPLSIPLLAIVLCGSACDDSTDPVTSPDLATGGTADLATASNTIVDVAIGNPQFSTLVGAVQKAGLVETLKGAGPFTVFAPTNDAFAALKAAGVDATALDVPTLTAVLKYHVVGGKKLAADVAASTSQTTLGGAVKVSSRDGGYYLNGITLITSTDIQASNGVIHVIDSVLLPDTKILDLVALATAYPSLSSLRGAVVSANLASALQATGPFTLFAPVNAAFSKLTTAPTAEQLPDILKYHVLDSEVGSAAALAVAAMATPNNKVPTLLSGKSITLTLSGSTLKIDAAAVTYTDIKVKNGVVHLLDSVLIP